MPSDLAWLPGLAWRRHVPHAVMAVAMLVLQLVPIAPLSPPVWFVTLSGAAIWLACTEEDSAPRLHGTYDLAGMAVLALAMPMPGMSGGAPLLAGCWLAGKLAVEIRRPLRDPANAAMAVAMCLMLAPI
ncbi:hypothetical protein [Amycolatopsis benzoatilytica]|uniref:hypothetical protein n=1 Tax=Amycolatopsis benzoatilytica TaxID=346045 RepID=UPI000360D6A5|nr:hypothetical protein [Amycolatopsis benzoatilytica]